MNTYKVQIFDSSSKMVSSVFEQAGNAIEALENAIDNGLYLPGDTVKAVIKHQTRGYVISLEVQG